MSINPEFASTADFYKSETEKPLAPDGLPVQPFRDNPGTLVMPNDSKPVGPFEKEPEAPGFFKTVGMAIPRVNEFLQAGKFAQRQLQFMHPSDDEVPEDFDPTTLEHLQNYPPKFWNFLADATSPNDMAARQQYVSEQVQSDEEYESGSLAGKLVGGALGFITSPSNLIPMSAAFKGATIGQSVIRSMMQAAPGMAAQTIAHEGFMQATDAGGNMRDFALNTLRDTAYGVAFLGAGAGLGASMRGAKLWNGRKIANIVGDGMEVNPVIDAETGEMIGAKVSAMPGEALSAAKLDQAQLFVDVAMKENILFQIPGVKKVLGNSLVGSPIVKAYSSRFTALRLSIDRLASHSILTKQVEAGEARADTAEDILSAFNAGAINFAKNYESHYLEQNGIIGGVNALNAAKALKQRALKQPYMPREEFNKQVVDTVLTQSPSDSKSINAAAQLYTEFTDSIYKEFQGAYGFDPKILSPRTANGYVTIVPDTLALTKDPEKFRQVCANEFKIQDKLIESIMQPLNRLNAHLKLLREAKLRDNVYDKSLLNEIELTKQKIREAKKEIEARARSESHDDINYSMILKDRNYLTVDESDELKRLLKPYKDAKKKTDKQESKIESLKSEHAKIKEFAIKAKKPETKKAHTTRMKEIEEQLKEEDKIRAGLQSEHEGILFELEDQARAEIINRKFFNESEGAITFRNPNEWAKFRKPFANDDARIAAAEAQRQVYLNNTAEQVQQAVLHNILPGQFANPMKRRTFMVSTKVLNDNNFIRQDVPAIVQAYTRSLGKHIALKRAFKDVPLSFEKDSPIPIALGRMLADERQKFENEISQIKDKDKRQKELLKLQKNFENDTKLLGDLFNHFLGKHNTSRNAMRVNRALKNFAVSTKLGGVPVSQLNDIAGIILKHGVWDYIRHGLKPMIEALFNKELNEARKRNAAHAHLSLQNIHGAYSAKHYDGAMDQDIPIGLQLESGLEKVANLSGNFFGTNLVDNINQRMVSGIMQSKIMENMHEYLEGALSENDLQGLLQYGLDPKEWAERFVKEFKKAGGWKDELGAYQSKFYDWTDNEAVRRMSMTIRRGVQDTIIQKGLFTSPFWADNPILSSVFMFHGWAFAAFNRFTVPMMQKMDAQKTIGIIAMLGIGAMSDMLRRYANGQKSQEDNDTAFGEAFKAVASSGILGHTTDLLQIANKLAGGTLLPATTQKYKQFNKFGVLGPVAGMTEDVFKLLGAVERGEITENEAKAGTRLIPLAGSIATRGLVNKWVESLGLPQHHGQQ